MTHSVDNSVDGVSATGTTAPAATRMGPGQATFVLAFGVLVLTVDAVVHQLRGEAVLRPAAVPLVLGAVLLVASNLFAAENSRPRVATQIVTYSVLLVGVALALAETFG